MTLHFGAKTNVRTYAISGAKVTVNWTVGGHPYSVICVKTVTPTGHDPAVVGWIRAMSAKRNNVAYPLKDLCNFMPDTAYIVTNFKAGGQMSFTEYTSAGTVNRALTGSWATGPGGVLREVVQGHVSWVVYYSGTGPSKSLAYDNGDSVTVTSRSWLVGSWRAVSCKFNGAPANLAERVYAQPDTTKMVAIVRADGTITVTEYKNGVVNNVQYPTWSTSGSQLTWSTAGTGPYVITPKNFTFSFSTDGGTLSVTFLRLS